MVVSIFSMSDKDGRIRFFEKSFLLANFKPDIVLRMPFLTMNNANINFQARDLQWRFYTTKQVLPITKKVELIGKKEFTVAALDLDHEAFVVYVTTLNISSDAEVHPSKSAQIAQQKTDKALTEVPSKYADFVNVFLPKLATELPKHTGINNHAIELVDDRELLCGPIYSLGSIELERFTSRTTWPTVLSDLPSSLPELPFSSIKNQTRVRDWV